MKETKKCVGLYHFTVYVCIILLCIFVVSESVHRSVPLLFLLWFHVCNEFIFGTNISIYLPISYLVYIWKHRKIEDGSRREKRNKGVNDGTSGYSCRRTKFIFSYSCFSSSSRSISSLPFFSTIFLSLCFSFLFFCFPLKAFVKNYSWNSSKWIQWSK